MEQSARGGRRVGFFGGSFDPPHLGHLAVAQAARAALSLDTVLFAPVGAQPLKPEGSTAGFDDRVAMTRLAIAGKPSFELSLIDAPRPGAAPNFTLDALLALRAELPPDGRLFCLIGADSLLSLRHWHRAAEIPFAASLVVASRPGQSFDDLLTALPDGLTLEPATNPSDAAPQPAHDATALRSYRLRNPAGDSAPLYLLPGLHVQISASQIRALIRDDRSEDRPPAVPAQQLLPAAVLHYIRTHGLYR